MVTLKSIFFQDVDYTMNGTDDYGANEWEHQDQPQVQALITWYDSYILITRLVLYSCHIPW